jgi:IPT/TIG domain
MERAKRASQQIDSSSRARRNSRSAMSVSFQVHKEKEIMKSRAPERKLLVGLAALVAAAIPLLATGCGGGLVSPLNAGTSQQSGPTIISIVPDSASPAGGTIVTINGSNFTSGTQTTAPSVSFGGVAATNVRVVSPIQLSATVPPHSSGSVSVEVTTADGASASVPSAFTYSNSAPAISGISPNSGDTTGGTVVTIAGSNFVSGATVSFGGSASSSVSFVSSNQLKATTPAHAAASVNVVVTNPDGTSATVTGGFTFGTSSLTVSSVSPVSGPAAGGTTVTITGVNFQTGVSVTFGGLAATSVTLSNSSTIVAVTPTHSSGSVDVTVTNPDGQSAALAGGFAFHSIDLMWNAPSSTTVTVAGYNVYRGNASTGPFGRISGSTPLADTSFTDATVQGGTTYYYEVRSVDSSGTESAPAGPVPATTSP